MTFAANVRFSKQTKNSGKGGKTEVTLKICDLQRLYKLGTERAASDEGSELQTLIPAAKKYISDIEEDEIRYAMYEHYINFRSWEKIADIFGCGTGDAVRKRCRRYMDKNS